MTEWFEEWFGEEYLALYPHRDDADADRMVALIRRTLDWRDGWRVLDVACGAGRHARALSDRGGRTIGLDLSMPLLRRARTVAELPYVRADMRSLPVRARSMDLVVNLFTSFGYFATDDEHEGALGQMVQSAHVGGWFVLDFFNAECIIATLVPCEETTLGAQAARIERRLEGDQRFVVKTITLEDGHQFVERVRLLSADALRAMLAHRGATVKHEFGTYDGGPLTPRSPRVILMAQVG